MDILGTVLQALQQNYAVILSLVGFLAFCIKYWENVSRFLGQTTGKLKELLDNFCLWADTNPKIRKSITCCKLKEPALQLYKDILPIAYKVDRRAQNLRIELRNDRALAILPSCSKDNLVEGLKRHVEENVAQTSTIKEHEKMEKALEIFCIEKIVEHSRIDGAFKIGVSKFASKAREDEVIQTSYNVLQDMNAMLKEPGLSLSRLSLTMVLTEFCRGELDAFGKVLV